MDTPLGTRESFRTVGGIQVNGEYVKLLELERKATEVLVLHAERIPNLLQSEHYMLMQYKTAGHDPLDPVDAARILQPPAA